MASKEEIGSGSFFSSTIAGSSQVDLVLLLSVVSQDGSWSLVVQAGVSSFVSQEDDVSCLGCSLIVTGVVSCTGVDHSSATGAAGASHSFVEVIFTLLEVGASHSLVNEGSSASAVVSSSSGLGFDL